MIVTNIGNSMYLLKGEKIHLVKAKTFWGLIGKAIIAVLKEFWDRL